MEPDKSKSEVIDETKNERRENSFAWMMGVSHLKNAELEKKNCNDSGSCAVFTEQGSPANGGSTLVTCACNFRKAPEVQQLGWQATPTSAVGRRGSNSVGHGSGRTFETADLAKDAIGLGALTAVLKENGSIRGIVTGDSFRRGVARTMAKQCAKIFDQGAHAFSVRALHASGG